MRGGDRTLNDVKQFIIDYIDANKAEYLDVIKQVWGKPELGMEELFASTLYAEILEKKGFTVERGVAGMPTAFVATYGTEDLSIGFSVEYDALPGLSQKVQTTKEPVSSGAPGQGCGRNLIGTGAVLAADVFKAAIEKFGIKARLKVFGTPAEELCIGKPVMGNAGLFEGLDAVIDWHPWFESSGNYKETPAYFNVKFHYKGRTAHGNSPWHGRSALDGAILQTHAIEMFREYMVPEPNPDAAHTINYTFSDTGPEFASVVPDRATLWVIGRFTISEDLTDILPRIVKTAEGAAMMTGTTAEILAGSAVDLATKPEIIERAQAEWKEKRGNREYKSLVPERTPIPLDINKEVMAKYRTW